MSHVLRYKLPFSGLLSAVPDASACKLSRSHLRTLDPVAMCSHSKMHANLDPGQSLQAYQSDSLTSASPVSDGLTSPNVVNTDGGLPKAGQLASDESCLLAPKSDNPVVLRVVGREDIKGLTRSIVTVAGLHPHFQWGKSDAADKLRVSFSLNACCCNKHVGISVGCRMYCHYHSS